LVSMGGRRSRSPAELPLRSFENMLLGTRGCAFAGGLHICAPPGGVPKKDALSSNRNVVAILRHPHEYLVLEWGRALF